MFLKAEEPIALSRVEAWKSEKPFDAHTWMESGFLEACLSLLQHATHLRPVTLVCLPDN